MLPTLQKMRGISSQKEYTKKKHKDNIQSFGLILFFINEKNTENATIYYLAQERRDTFEYGECLQGFWNTLERLKICCFSMTIEELKRIDSHTFDELWEDLWIDKETRMYKEGYIRAKKKFEESEVNLRCHIKECLSRDEMINFSPPWGFPKGRKTSYEETDQQCAIRESEEECRVPRDLYRILPFKYSEKFLGSNGISYSTTYFLCEVKEKYVPPRIDTSKNCIRTSSISEEVNDVEWLIYDDICTVLNSQRRSILCEANDLIKKLFIPKL